MYCIIICERISEACHHWLCTETMQHVHDYYWGEFYALLAMYAYTYATAKQKCVVALLYIAHCTKNLNLSFALTKTHHLLFSSMVLVRPSIHLFVPLANREVQRIEYTWMTLKVHVRFYYLILSLCLVTSRCSKNFYTAMQFEWRRAQAHLNCLWIVRLVFFYFFGIPFCELNRNSGPIQNTCTCTWSIHGHVHSDIFIPCALSQ